MLVEELSKVTANDLNHNSTHELLYLQNLIWSLQIERHLPPLAQANVSFRISGRDNLCGGIGGVQSDCTAAGKALA